MPMLALSIFKLNSLTLPLARQYTNPLNQVARLYRWCIFWPQM